MISRPVSSIVFFEIVELVESPVKVWATYGSWAREDVAIGSTHVEQIRRTAASGALPNNSTLIQKPSAYSRHRLLDIVEWKHGDDSDYITRAYAFRLNAKYD